MENPAPHPSAAQRPLINVAIRSDLHRKLKLLAVSRGVTLQDLVEKSIKDGIGEIPNSLDLSQENGKTAPATPVDPAA